jgi:hypothetical protein
MTVQQLPTELIDSCVNNYLDQTFSQNLSGMFCEHLKPTWTSVGPLSLVSRRVRHLSLERWFSIAVFSNGKTIGQLHGTPYSNYCELVRYAPVYFITYTSESFHTGRYISPSNRIFLAIGTYLGHHFITSRTFI